MGTNNDYNVHNTDSEGRNLWSDLHLHDYLCPTYDSRFHPPLNAVITTDDVESSCITVTEVEIVTRAVHIGWQLVYNRVVELPKSMPLGADADISPGPIRSNG